jgi:hypothetical protein
MTGNKQNFQASGLLEAELPIQRTLKLQFSEQVGHSCLWCDSWYNLEDVTPGWMRLNRTIIVNSTIDFEVLTCGDGINNSVVNFLTRRFGQYL